MHVPTTSFTVSLPTNDQTLLYTPCTPDNECEPGSKAVVVNNRLTCVPCAAGWYQTRYNQTNCIKCDYVSCYYGYYGNHGYHGYHAWSLWLLWLPRLIWLPWLPCMVTMFTMVTMVIIIMVTESSSVGIDYSGVGVL